MNVFDLIQTDSEHATPSEPTTRQMVLQEADLEQFAEWSGDRNPLHVDSAMAKQTFFGRTIAHGVLGAIRALSSRPTSQRRYLKSVDIEFRGAVIPDAPCEVNWEFHEGIEKTQVCSDTDTLMSIQSEFVEAPQDGISTDQISEFSDDRFAMPVDRRADEVETGMEFTGRYQTPADIPSCLTDALVPLQLRVFALCSYLVGMELPGLRSLFTRLTLDFQNIESDSRSLTYNLRVSRFDAHFRILDTELTVETPSGDLIATGTLRSYFRFTPCATDLSQLQHAVGAHTAELNDRVALVIGGNRGLGGDITAGLALAGCRVIASYRSSSEAAEALAEQLKDRNADVEFVRGDAGDPEWCAGIVDQILNEYGRIDLLVLNACEPPRPVDWNHQTSTDFADYIGRNLSLATNPLRAALPALEKSGGTIVAVSSSFVDELPEEFPQYIALKQAVENAVRSACNGAEGLSAIIARPPRLQTSWNDTPTGVLGTLPSERAAVALIRAVAHASTPGHAELLTEFPEVERSADREQEDTASSLSIALAATFTADPILPGLQFWFDELSLAAAPAIAPYGQVLQELLNPTSLLSSNQQGVNIVLIRVGDWLRELDADELESASDWQNHLESAADELVGAVQSHRQHAAVDTILMLCPSDASEFAVDGNFREIEARIAERLTGTIGLQVVRLADFHQRFSVGESDIHDPLRNEIGHIPYRDPYYQVMATVVARNIHRRLVTPRKVVVVDCDNTLWRGVVGEIGPEGVGFDEGHLELHQALIRLNESGVLLALCSKNEAEDVWSVFDTRSDFALNRDRIVTSMINWNAKSENLRTLSERLNLGLDSFIFIDDNPVECAEVQAGCPEVLTLQWPQEPDRALNLLQHTWELDPRQGTREDQKRTQLYQEEFSRQELQSNTQTFRDFIKSLKLDIQIAPLAIDDLPRASQLTLRTNQFNFTTRRRNESEVRSLINSEQHAIRSVKVRDRFGDYGFVGLLIAERQSETLDVDTFLLSCRVLGRGVEHRMAAELGRMASESDLQTVRLTIRFTDRNEPARKFLSSILSEDYQKLDRDSLACTVPRDVMSAVEFQPDDGAAVSGKSAKNTSHSSLSAGPATSSREREQQVYRTAYELNTAAALQSAVAVVNDGSAAQKGLEPDVDIEDVVYSAFSKSLRISEEEIRREDRLEALRCDSFKIVEITVALAESFPWLPSTLLFEHRSVSEIVERVRELSADSEPGLAHNRSLQVIGSSSETPDTNYDVAVVGIDVRCGGAGSPEELWSLLSEGRSAVRRVSKDRPAFLRLLEQDRPYWASLLDDVEGFDADFFGIAPREAKMMDPQLRLILQVAWGALEDAGLVGTNHLPDTGVFTGVMYHDYAQAANSAARHANSPYRCWEGFSLANRVSQLFDFHGPSIAVDTACSSSGTALHLACQALHIGECKAAIVAGVNLILDTNRFAHLGQLGILSDTGACRAFGSEANGTVLGEGAGVVVLRPLREARDRGDRIYGVIKGTALNSGTGTVGFTAPHPGAQSEAIRAAVARSGIDPRTISYVETHGTGTALGDPIEIRGLTLGYLDKQLWTDDISGSHVCRIGSIKPNIGHLEAGAGILGLIKILLQLQHRQLVPSLTSDETNPQIPFDDVPFEVSRGLQPWEAPVFQQNDRTVTYPRRAGLSSFGVGGANSHVIVEEAMDVAEVNESQEPAIERPVHLLVLSARHEETLQEQATRLREYLIAHPDVSLGDVAQTLTTCREHFERRTAIVAPDNESAVAELQAIRPADNDQFDKQPAGDPRVAFLFTGQGSQHARMGRELYETSPVFRATIDRCAAILEEHLEHPLLDVLFAEEGSEQAALVHQTAYTQPCLFAVEFASYELWKSWGVEPVSVLGHSIGEIVALCAAGALTLEDGLKLVAARGRLMQAIPAGGSMVSVRADESTVRRILSTNDAGVDVAAVNSPQQTVISGESKPVAEVVERFSREGIKTTALTVSHAFHSSLMEPMLEEFEAIAASVSVVDPQIPVISCVTGETLTQADITSGYWSRQVRDSVCFTDALHALDKLNIDAYVETGPQPILSGLGQTTLADQQRLWLPSLKRKGRGDWSTVLSSLGKLYRAGGRIDWNRFNEAYSHRTISLPSYPFRNRRFWIDTTGIQDAVTDSTPSVDDATRDELADKLYAVTWREIPQGIGGEPVPETTEGQWLVFADESGSGDAFADVLRSRGVTCTVIRRDSTAINGFGIRQVVESQVDPDSNVAGIAYLRGLDASPAESVAGTCDSLGELLQLIHGLSDWDRWTGRIWCLTSGAVRTKTESLTTSLNVEQAPIWGFGRTAALELSDRWGGLIDLDSGGNEDQLSLAVSQLLADFDPENQLALRDGKWYVPRVTRIESGKSERFTVDPEGLYIIVGGLGSLGQHVARWLIEKGARHLLLTGRRGLDSPESHLAVETLRDFGAEIEVVAADVSFQDGVDRIFNAVDRQAAPLRGVFHAAGIDCVQPIADMTLETLEHMLASKVTGGRLLHEATLKRELDMFVMFSSFTSVFGSAGRAHYGAANAFLDALAVSRQAAGLPATVINWGPWSGGGMATPESLQMLERMGNRGLDVASALSALEHVISRNISQAVVADIDWPQFRAVYEARGKRPLISEVSNFPESAPSAVHLNHNGWIPRLLQSSEADRHAALTELLQSEVADILGFGDPDEVQPDRDLFELGMDSLTAVELTNRIQRNLTLSEGGYLLDEPQIDRLAKRLIEEVDFEQAGDQTAERATKEQKNGRPQPSWTVQLQQRDAAGRCEELTSLLRGEVAAILGYDEPEEIPLDKNLVELGMDSLTAVEFTRRLERNLGLENAVQVFDFENLAVLAEHLAGETTSDQGDRNGVTKFVRGLEASTYEFAKIAWPTRRDDWIVPRWDWMYLESAARMKVEPRVWLYQDGDAVVGHHGGIPVNLQVGQQTHGTVWLVETMVREEYRKQAVGSRLLIQAKQELPFTLSLGQTAQMREILIRLGWRQVAPLETWMLPLNFAKVVADKLPMRVLAGPAGIAMKLQQFAKRSLGGPSAQGCQVSRLDRFDERHDDLWERVGGEYPCAVVRDASYLNWKYVDQPGQEFIRLELSREGKPVAIATLMVRDPDNAYSYRRAFLVDLVVSPTDRALHFAVFDEVCNACRELQADALFFHFINDSIRASVRRYGFLERPATRYFLVCPEGVSDDVSQSVLRPENWLITMGDSDIDRPW